MVEEEEEAEEVVAEATVEDEVDAAGGCWCDGTLVGANVTDAVELLLATTTAAVVEAIGAAFDAGGLAAALVAVAAPAPLTVIDLSLSPSESPMSEYDASSLSSEISTPADVVLDGCLGAAAAVAVVVAVGTRTAVVAALVVDVLAAVACVATADLFAAAVLVAVLVAAEAAVAMAAGGAAAAIAAEGDTNEIDRL